MSAKVHSILESLNNNISQLCRNIYFPVEFCKNLFNSSPILLINKIRSHPNRLFEVRSWRHKNGEQKRNGSSRNYLFRTHQRISPRTEFGTVSGILNEMAALFKTLRGSRDRERSVFNGLFIGEPGPRLAFPTEEELFNERV